jgi:hypothetical protein
VLRHDDVNPFPPQRPEQFTAQDEQNPCLGIRNIAAAAKLPNQKKHHLLYAVLDGRVFTAKPPSVADKVGYHSSKIFSTSALTRSESISLCRL